MDETKYLIVLKSEDRTSSVLFYSIKGSEVLIDFINGDRTYKYSIQNVIIRENPTVIDRRMNARHDV